MERIEPTRPRDESPSGRLKRLAYPLVIVAAWLAFFSPALFAGRLFFCRDLFFMHEPLRRYWTGLVSSGHAPFLNAALNMGEPLLANPINAVCYPANLLYFLLPFGGAWNLILAGHVLWAALGVYWLARKLDCAGPAALTGALAFAFCGPLLSSLDYYNLLVATSWIPWAAGCALMAWRGGAHWTAATTVALAAQCLAGEPTIVILTAGLLVGGYTIGLIQDRSHYGVVLTRGAFIIVVAMMLASIQILPTLLWLPHSGRSAGLPFRESAAYWSLHPARLAEFLVPHIFGNPSAHLAPEFWGAGYSDSGLPLILKLYAGWIPLLLLPLALRRSAGRWASFVCATSLVLSFGHRLPGYHALYTVLAPLRMVRYPEKFTILSALALAAATAIGLSDELRARDGGDARRSRLVLVSTLGGLLALLLVLAYFLPHASLSAEQRAQQLGAVGKAAIVGAVSCLALVLTTLPRYRRIATGLIPAVLLLDLASVTWDVAGTRPRGESDSPPALLANLGETPSTPIIHLGEHQSDAYFAARREPFQSMQDALHPFTGLRWGLAYGAVDDVDRMGWKVAEARQGLLHSTIAKALAPGDDRLDRAAVATKMLRACGIGRVVSLAPLAIDGLHQESALALPDGPTVRVYVADSGFPPLVRFESGGGSITWRDEAPQRIDIAVDVPAQRTVVVARNALPGWRAVCDGQRLPLTASGEGFLRLTVPPGAHRLQLRYSPPGVLAGALLSASGLAALLASLVFVRWRTPTR